MTDDGPSFFAVPRGNTAQRERPRSPRRRRAAPDTTPPGNAYLAYYTSRYRALSHIGNVTKIASMVAAEWNCMDAAARQPYVERATAPQKPCFFETKKSPRRTRKKAAAGARAGRAHARRAGRAAAAHARRAGRAAATRAGRAAAAHARRAGRAPRPPSRPRRRHPSRPRRRRPRRRRPRPPSRPSRVRHSGCCCWCFWCCCCLCFCCCCCCLCCFSC